MALGFVTLPEAEELMDEIPYKMAESPWNYNKTLLSGQKVVFVEMTVNSR